MTYDLCEAHRMLLHMKNTRKSGWDCHPHPSLNL